MAILFGCEVVGTLEADKRGRHLSRTSGIVQDQFRSFEEVSASVVSIICGPVQWWIFLNSLNLFGCLAVLVILVCAPEVVPAKKNKKQTKLINFMVA